MKKITIIYNEKLQGYIEFGMLTTSRRAKFKMIGDDQVQITRFGYTYTTGKRNFGSVKSNKAYEKTQKVTGKIVSQTPYGAGVAKRTKAVVEVSKEDARRLT